MATLVRRHFLSIADELSKTCCFRGFIFHKRQGSPTISGMFSHLGINLPTGDQVLFSTLHIHRKMGEMIKTRQNSYKAKESRVR